jgi:GTP cyclohydrolase II
MPSKIVPLPRTPALLVQRAARGLRAGKPVILKAPGTEARILPAERTNVGGEPWPPGASLAITGHRLASLGVARVGEGIWRLPLDAALPAKAVAGLVDPTLPNEIDPASLRQRMQPGDELAAGAIDLCKLAGLLPAAICLRPELHADAVTVLSATVRAYRRLEALSLQPVSEARVPLAGAEDTRVVAFRPADGGAEQFAIIVGEPETAEAPLCRLHSECFTGDLLGSLRCDCGEQLRGAILRMAEEGAGVLLYLAQEGRGIGLANKLRAYALQDSGLDTVDANTHLGFEPDERRYLAAATMLRHLGLTRVRLLTNNPAKVQQLAGYDIEVADRVPHVFEANEYNQGYLITKALRSGHEIEIERLNEQASPTRGRYAHG